MTQSETPTALASLGNEIPAYILNEGDVTSRREIAARWDNWLVDVMLAHPETQTGRQPDGSAFIRLSLMSSDNTSRLQLATFEDIMVGQNHRYRRNKVEAVEIPTNVEILGSVLYTHTTTRRLSNVPFRKHQLARATPSENMLWQKPLTRAQVAGSIGAYILDGAVDNSGRNL